MLMAIIWIVVCIWRHFNPTVLNLSRQMAAMEGMDAAYCTSSGMSAISTVLMQLCSSGDHIVASSRLYGGTHALLAHFLPRTSNITTTFVDISNPSVVGAAIKSSTKVLYFESVSNPQLIVANIPVLSGTPVFPSVAWTSVILHTIQDYEISLYLFACTQVLNSFHFFSFWIFSTRVIYGPKIDLSSSLSTVYCKWKDSGAYSLFRCPAWTL